MDYLPILIAYLLGSMPFGYILARMIKKVDLLRYGSGNIGATNTMRLLGWRGGLIVFILDAGKGVAAVLLARAFTAEVVIHLAAAFMALVGHSFSIFLRFRGGKGAATGIGVLAPLAGWVTLVLVLLFAAVTAATRYVSLGSILGALSLPLLFWLFGYPPPYIYFGAALAALVVARHHANIGRLLKGQESKLGRKANSTGEGST